MLRALFYNHINLIEMNKLHKTAVYTIALAGASTLSAQGLLSIGGNGDFKSDIPLTLTLGVGAGYDSNINTASNSADELDSAWYQAGVGLSYGWNQKITQATLGLGASYIRYQESGDFDNDDINGRVSLNVTHAASPRLTLGGSLYVAYEAEPDFAIGVASARRSGEYFYLNGSANATYALNRRLSVALGYTFGTIIYDSRVAAGSEDRVDQTVSVDLQYGYSRTTTAVIGARWGFVNYDSLNADYDTYSVYVGADKEFSARMSGSLRVGASIYENSGRGATEAAPMLEAAINYLVDRSTTASWYHRLGFEGSELSSFDSRYSYRTGVTLAKQLNRRTSLQIGAHYAHSELGNSEELGDVSEDQLYANFGVSYRLYRNFDLNADYTFITLLSDTSQREFDRHRVSVGASATF